MIASYVKTAWRNITKQKLTAFISISSLAIGLAVCFIIGLYVLHEWSYDRFVPDSERIARVVVENEEGYRAATPPGLAHALETGMSGIESLTEVSGSQELIMASEEASLEIGSTFWADSNFTDIFPLKEIGGDAARSLSRPGMAVLTHSSARRLFGDDDPLGKVLEVEYGPGVSVDHEVGAVVEDPPANMHFRYNVLLSMTHPAQRAQRYGDEVQWNYWGGYVYVKVEEHVGLPAFRERMTRLESRMEKPDSWDDEPVLAAQKLTDIHLAEGVSSEIAPQGDRQYLLIFSAIGLLILGMACFNYMNLSTARTLPRADEVGMRKVAGASRGSLVLQFLTEAVVTALLAFPLALLITEAALPPVQEFLGKEFAFGLFETPVILLAAAGVVLLSGLLSGVYPALVISSCRPADIFRRGRTQKGGGFSLQKGLVVLQFAIAVLFIASTLVIHRQMTFVQQKNLGFDEERVIVLEVGALQERYESFKNEALTHASVQSVSSGAPPGIGWKNMTTTGGRASESPDTEQWLSVINVDYDYVETAGLRLIAGRDYSGEFALDDENAVILNEAAAGWFGLGEEAVGEQVEISDESRTVVGLVEDFHNESLKRNIQPVALLLEPGNRYTGMARLPAGNIDQGLDALRSTWEEFLPGRPFVFSFLDDRIQAQYRTEQRQAGLMSAFSGIALFVACFGLLGLASLMTVRRTKEIGIRKVLGATVRNIVGLLSKDFVKLVIIGFLIAAPVAYYAMNQWLANFAYSIRPGIGLFALAGGMALLIALATVSWQAVRAALANPVDSLRSE